MKRSTGKGPSGPPRGPAQSRPRKTSVLIKFGHGLGDAVQCTIVLKHLAKYRPDWEVDVQSLLGKHSGRHAGLCRRALVNGESVNQSSYDRVIDLPWHESKDRRYANAPNTKAARALRECFGLEPDVSLFGYEIRMGPEARRQAAEYLERISGRPAAGGRFPVAAIHYQGNTSAERKNLDHGTAAAVCQRIIECGHVPMILDWDERSPLPDQERIFCPAQGAELWRGKGTGDAERLAALIDQCAWCVAIDSGPQKAAGATTTPTAAVWTGHHPLYYYDLCDNVLHLTPSGDPLNEDAFFKTHYRRRTYRDVRQTLEALVCEMLVPHEGNLIHCRGFTTAPTTANRTW